MPRTAQRLAVIFSNVGHAYVHMMAVYYFLVVLALERDWGLSYAELIELWTVGALLVAAAALAVAANVGSLPAENMLLAAATREQRYGLAFGAKFVLSFGAAPVAIQIVSHVTSTPGAFTTLFSALGILIATACGLALLSPSALGIAAPVPTSIEAGLRASPEEVVTAFTRHATGAAALGMSRSVLKFAGGSGDIITPMVFLTSMAEKTAA